MAALTPNLACRPAHMVIPRRLGRAQARLGNQAIGVAVLADMYRGQVPAFLTAELDRIATALRQAEADAAGSR